VAGYNSSTTGGITIGSNSPGNLKNGAIIIGHGITPLEDDATYMNKFRTGVTPVGTAWTLTWDDSTKEVYAASSGPVVPNWYMYQDNGFGAAISLALPAATPSTMPAGSYNWLQSIGTWSTPSGWFSSSGYFFNGYTYAQAYGGPSYPLADPTVTSPTAYGLAISYYMGYEADTGATNTVQLYYGPSTFQSSGSTMVVPGFSVFGTTQYGHAIVMLSGNYTTGFTPASGSFSVLDTVYDSYSNTTFIFIDVDAAGVSSMSSGGGIGSIGGFTSYAVIFWYNY
jgi:hypothetical protein